MSKKIWLLQALCAFMLAACSRGSDNQQTTLPEQQNLTPAEEEEIQRVRGTEDQADPPGIKENYPSGSPMQEPDPMPDITTPPPDPMTAPDPADPTRTPLPPPTGEPTSPETTTPLPPDTSATPE